MHAYLIVSRDKNSAGKKANDIAKKLGADIVNIQLNKISDIRQMGRFTKLKLEKPTVILSEQIDKATTDSLNAFLKSLEEPQKNLTYVLTADAEHAVLPTILSRCHVIKVKDNRSIEQSSQEEVSDFLKMDIGEKFQFIESYKKREDAIQLMENFLQVFHLMLTKGKTDYRKIAKFTELSQHTLSSIKANGNVFLQLTNFVINIHK
jgi:DNA polymerase III delta prime subunit